MNLLKKVFYQTAAIIPSGVLKSISPITTLFPYQHTVSDSVLLHIKHLYPYKGTKQFTKDLDFILKDYRPITANDIWNVIQKGDTLPKNTFLLSFDDGFRETEEIIAPILIAKGVPAVFFINPAFVDNRELFYRCKISLVIERLIEKKENTSLLNTGCEILGLDKNTPFENLIRRIKIITNLDAGLLDKLAPHLDISFEEYLYTEKPFLSMKQLESLVKMGFELGGHSWNHPYFHLLSIDEQIHQTSASIDFINAHFTQKIKLFSFPHSDSGISNSYFQHTDSVDMFFGTQNQKLESNHNVFHRFNTERPDLPLQQQIKGILLLSFLQRLFAKNQVTRFD
ncbi:MAG: polysaccharide deacetylase family protein [Terrimonas sp.]|nr:polysaccharide deacetylase family protein [Terrimonas sp.]